MNPITYKISCWFDAPQILDCTFQSIPGSGSLPLQVVASTAKFSTQLSLDNSTGQYIGIYSGIAGSEKLVVIVGVSQPFVPFIVGAGIRISVRNMVSTAISSGSLMCQFLTPAL